MSPSGSSLSPFRFSLTRHRDLGLLVSLLRSLSDEEALGRLGGERRLRAASSSWFCRGWRRGARACGHQLSPIFSFFPLLPHRFYTSGNSLDDTKSRRDGGGASPSRSKSLHLTAAVASAAAEAEAQNIAPASLNFNESSLVDKSNREL